MEYTGSLRSETAASCLGVNFISWKWLRDLVTRKRWKRTSTKYKILRAPTNKTATLRGNIIKPTIARQAKANNSHFCQGTKVKRADLSKGRVVWVIKRRRLWMTPAASIVERERDGRMGGRAGETFRGRRG